MLVLGVLSGLLSIFAFVVGLSHGNDIQLIAAGVFGTMSVVCFGFSSTLAQSRPKDSPAGLARELLDKWESIDGSIRERLAKTLIGKMNPTLPPNELASFEGPALKSLLAQLASEPKR